MEEDIHSLKPGTVINNFEIIRVLGEGGFGITYLARDRELGHEVVIKEYFPNEFAMRTADTTITAKRTATAHFSKGLQRFKEEAQTLARFNHPSIVKILSYFEANDTAYFVMEYEEGIDLSHYLRQVNRPLTQEEILGIVIPILEGLKEVHRYNFLHRDIKPGNILLRSNNAPVLIDFGASKQTVTDVSKSVTSMLTEGYAPLEQYSTDIRQQGPFTDIYAIAAVMYKMITQEVPPSAQTRSYQLLQDGHDPYKPLKSMGLAGYDHNFLNAIDRALSIKAKYRPQNVQDFQADIVGQLTMPEPERTEENISAVEPKTKNTVLKIAASLVLVLLLGGGAVYYMNQQNENSGGDESDGLNFVPEQSTHVSRDKEAACNQGEMKACVNLGVAYLKGNGKPKDAAKATALFEKACTGNFARGCFDLGVVYSGEGSAKKDYFKAFESFKKACALGDPRGCVSTGLMYEKGEGVRQSDRRAVAYYAKACQGGDTEGCSYLGNMYENGKGVAQDMNKALSFYQKSCASDDPVGCSNLAFMYASGSGVAKDAAKAKELYKKACDEGDTMACENYNKL